MFLKMNLVLGLLWVLLLGSFNLCMAATKNYTFVLTESNFTRLCHTKSMLTVNESFPGPVLSVQKGDVVNVNVINQGKYGITIHWHGVKQPRNPWYDGPENITQCPIRPGSSFQYQVILSTEEGTLWWHAHSDWSRATVYGAFVVKPAENTTYPFPVPYKEEVIVLGSWYNGDVMAIIEEALATGADPNTSNSHTINGYTGNSTACATEQTYNLSVKYGKTYLLRLVNGVMNEEMLFGIANHNLTVVGMDGAYVKPFSTDYIYITPGQTMDILLNTTQSPSQYYMIAIPYFDSFAVFDNSSATAIVTYDNSAAPTTIPSPSFPAYNESTTVSTFTEKLRSLASTEHPVSVPKNITKELFTTVALNILPCPANTTCEGPYDQLSSASMNNISFATPKDSILEAYHSGKYSDVFNATFPNHPTLFNFTGNVTNISNYANQATKAIVLKWGEEVEMVIQGTAVQSPENHPMHLHGFSFYLVGFGPGNWNRTKREEYNLVDPPEINTVSLPRNGWAAIRFTADNPGVWFMHCHLERHTSWGMSTVVIVTDGYTNSTKMLDKPSYMPPCT